MSGIEPVAAVSPVAPAVDQPFDRQRGVHYPKPVLRGWLHLLWFGVSLVAGALLLAHTRGLLRFAAAAVYALSVSAMFGVSALYHRGNWAPARARRLQRLDHAMIFLLIGGTATPAILLTGCGTFGLACLTALWALILTAAAAHLAWMNRPELMVGATFVGLGLVAGLCVPGVWLHTGATAAVLLLTGGALYTVGALCYHRRWPNPYPAVFGYHEVFHAYVCAAATCQYLAIALIIVNRR
jgi:hemolysin III